MAIEVPISHIEVIDGKAYIKGRMLKVRMVAGMYIHAGATIEQVIEHYSLSAAEVHAALTYYYDHQAEYEAEDRALQPLIDQIKEDSEARKTQIKARMEAIRREGRTAE
jgi:uncharacterized protein (DUF433 family)